MQLTQQEIVVLRKTFLFHRLSPAAYMKLSEQNFYGAFRAELRTGSQLEYPTEDQNYLGVVIAGELTELRQPAFADRPLSEGGVIGVMDLFSRERGPRNEIVAKTRSLVVFFTAQQIRELFDACPGMMMRYINFLTARTQELRWEYLMAATPSALDRIRKYCAAQMDENDMVTMPRSMSELAERLHMSRSTLYRCLEQLEQDGVLQRQGKGLHILSPQSLKERSAESCE